MSDEHRIHTRTEEEHTRLRKVPYFQWRRHVQRPDSPDLVKVREKRRDEREARDALERLDMLARVRAQHLAELAALAAPAIARLRGEGDPPPVRNLFQG